MFFSKTAAQEVFRIRSVFGGDFGKALSAKELRLKFPLDTLSIAAGISASERQSWIGITFASSLLLFSISVFTGHFWFCLLAALPPMILKMKLEWCAARRAQNFEKDYPAFLLSLASSVRTGLDPLQAMTQSTELFESKSELGKALKIFTESIDQGIPEENAIRNFAGDIQHPDVTLFRAGFLLSRREGSSLAECLLRLARVTRQRQSFRRKMKSAVAMQRVSGFGIAACSILICSIQALSNPTAFSEALHHPIGFKIIMIGASLLFLGTFWMLRMTRTKT